MVVALLVTMITFVLATTVLAQSIHNVTQSGYLRRRTTAIHAAEAGLNWFSELLSDTRLAQLSGAQWQRVGDLYVRTISDVASDPDQAKATIVVKYFANNPCAAAGVAPGCSWAGTGLALGSDASFPPIAYALVKSIGSVGSTFAGSPSLPVGGVRRALESAVRLTPSSPAGMNGISATYLCYGPGGSLTLTGDLRLVPQPAGWPVPTNLSSLVSGSVACNQGLNLGSGDKLNVTGDVLVSGGSVYFDANPAGGATPPKVTITGSLWAEGAVSLGTGKPSLPTSCGTSDVCLQSDVVGTTVDWGGGVAILGEVVECSPACPPGAATLDKITWDAFAGWDITTVSDAPTALSQLIAYAGSSPAAGSKKVFNITSTAPGTGAGQCDLAVNTGPTNSANFTIPEGVQIAVTSSCGFTFGSSTAIAGSGVLQLVSLWPGTLSAPGAPPTCDGSRDITFSNNSAMTANVVLYTPCILALENNQSPLSGQFLARYVIVKNSANLTAAGGGAGIPPPAGLIKGFKQDIRYIREVSPEP